MMAGGRTRPGGGGREAARRRGRIEGGEERGQATGWRPERTGPGARTKGSTKRWTRPPGTEGRWFESGRAGGGQDRAPPGWRTGTGRPWRARGGSEEKQGGSGARPIARRTGRGDGPGLGEGREGGGRRVGIPPGRSRGGGEGPGRVERGGIRQGRNPQGRGRSQPRGEEGRIEGGRRPSQELGPAHGGEGAKEAGRRAKREEGGGRGIEGRTAHRMRGPGGGGQR